MLNLFRKPSFLEDDGKVPLGFKGYANPSTPDIAELEMYELQFIFIPDEMREGARNHDLVGMYSVGLGNAYTKDSFSFFKKRVEMEDSPVLIPLPDLRSHRQKRDLNRPTSWHNNDYAKIRGELWAIRPYQIKALDIYKENGVQFHRKRVMIILPYRQVIKKTFPDGTYEKVLTGEQVHLLPAWMYIGNPDHWNGLIDAGFSFSKVPQFKSDKKWMDRYYEYRP